MILAVLLAAVVVADGYQGIWYMNQPVASEHRYKYSGGFATYPQQHVLIAIYVPSQQKTFFVYGGSAGNVSESKDELLHMVSYYDHRTRTVPRPIVLLHSSVRFGPTDRRWSRRRRRCTSARRTGPCTGCRRGWPRLVLGPSASADG